MDDQYKTVRIMRPENTLLQKIGSDVKVRELLKPEVIEQAQQLVDEQRIAFLNWRTEDAEKLPAAFAALSTGEPEEGMARIYHHACLVRDRAGTFNYQMATDVARSLVNYLDALNGIDHSRELVIQKHLEGIDMVFRMDISGNGGLAGMELLDGLSKLVAKFPPQVEPGAA